MSSRRDRQLRAFRFRFRLLTAKQSTCGGRVRVYFAVSYFFTFSSSVCLTVKWARFSLGTAWGKHTDGIQPETRVDFFKISIYTGTARFRDPLHFDRSAPEHT